MPTYGYTAGCIFKRNKKNGREIILVIERQHPCFDSAQAWLKKVDFLLGQQLRINFISGEMRNIINNGLWDLLNLRIRWIHFMEKTRGKNLLTQ